MIRIKETCILCLLLLCLALQDVMAQRGKLFNTDNQLSSNLATQVFQDSNGFIWIATRNGLNAYDGYNFTVMKKDAHDPKKLNSNYINCISQDNQGRLLLGTNNSLLSYDGDKFTSIPLIDSKGKSLSTYVNQVYRMKNGDALVATSGYGLFVKKGNDTKCHPIKGAANKLKYVLKVLEDHKGNLWIISEDRKLYCLNKNGQLATNFAGTGGLLVQDIQEDKWGGNFYLATKDQGVYLLKQGSTVFTRITGIANLPIDNIYIGKNGCLYIGCDGQGLHIYNPKTGITEANPLFSREINFSKSKVTSIIEDATGNLWISMMQKGVFMQPQGQNDFGYMGFRMGPLNVIGENSVTSICEDQGNTVWIGTDKDGLYKFDIGTGLMKGHFLGQATVLALCKDKLGRTWVGTYTDGTGYLDASGSYHSVDLKQNSPVGVFDIKCDKAGNVWLATMGAGLVRITPSGDMKFFKRKPNADNNLKINSIPNDFIGKLSLSKDGNRLFAATSVGLACLDLKTGSWLSTFHGINCLNKGCFSHCVYVDSKNRVWYGTEDGVNCYDLSKSLTPKTYTTENGLTDNSITSFVEDSRGRLWIGTTGGLSKLNVETGNITKYFTENGLQSDEFSDGAACAIHGGNLIIMGGTGGLTWFDANKVKQHPWQAKVSISGFMIGNKKVTPNMKSGIYTIMEKWIVDSNQFDLSHDDNTFSLQLSTLTYNNVDQISYAYSINGEDWRIVQPGLNEISFSHMPAGTYHFKVKAISNGYETPVKKFTIVVHPAWYASFWARLCYLLLFLGLCLLYMKHRKRKEEDRLLLQKHIHAEEMGEAKLKFFMNISHEIRTPLTLILTPLLSLIKEDKDTHRQGIYDMIRKNSERILHLINQMMDLRKIDKGQMVMHMSETDMVAFVNDEYKLFEQQAQAKNIQFSFEHADESLPVWIDRDNFDKVLMNVLSNAFKFTPAGGKVCITLSHSPHHARIAIKDSGKGIDEDKLETIFQRFYQSPTSANDRNVGTGIGLDLTRSLVELHYGTITAANNKTLGDPAWKTGSEFLITLPLGKEHLKPEEILEPMPEVQAEEDIKELNENDAAEETPTPLEAELMEAKGDTMKKSTLAIVEDDEAILEYLDNQLQDMFNILTYHNGKEALPEITKRKTDLVISDIMMPEMDGNTLCAKLKSNVSTNHIPVILLTAMSREEDQLTGLQTGADAYIVKPFNMDILRRTIINLLNVRRTLRNKFTGSESQQDKIKQVEMVSPDDQLMKQVMAVINENIVNEDLSVDMIAKQVGISRVHLHRKMKELTNQTPHTFIRNLRLQQAAKLLRESKQSVSDVMYSCGFSNPASFSTMFKNMFGSSPRDYMNEQRAKQ